MFREMRRKRQSLSPAESEKILSEARTGVLGLCGDDGYPYTVPINFAYIDGRIYFHGAKSGHKADLLARSDKASLCVVQADEVSPDGLTNYFRSVIVYGRTRVLTDAEERFAAAERFGLCFCPDKAAVDNDIRRCWDALSVVELTPEHITGKQAKELIPTEDAAR